MDVRLAKDILFVTLAALVVFSSVRAYGLFFSIPTSRRTVAIGTVSGSMATIAWEEARRIRRIFPSMLVQFLRWYGHGRLND